MPNSPELVEIDDAVAIKGDTVIIDFNREDEVIKRIAKRNAGWYKPGQSGGGGWKPGQSGNPSGRPGLLSKAYRLRLASVMSDGRTYAEHVADNLVEFARGQTRLAVQAASELADRTEGKPRQTIEANVSISLADRIRRARAALNTPKTLDLTPIGESLSSQD